ncbi:MAG: hypothetical protein ACRER5_03085 [Pseudomonas sp.]
MAKDMPLAVIKGQCDACGRQRTDLIKKGRLICPACQALNSKKPKREGGTAGPSGNQLVLIHPQEAVFFTVDIVTPPGLPDGSRLEYTHGGAALAQILINPPPPPFYLALLAKNSDPVLGQTRLTHDLRRLHIGSDVPSVVDQPLLKKTVSAVMTHETPDKALATLRAVHSPLVRGPAADQERWADAMDAMEALHEQAPGLVDLFPTDGRWSVAPQDQHWAWLQVLVRTLMKEIP